MLTTTSKCGTRSMSNISTLCGDSSAEKTARRSGQNPYDFTTMNSELVTGIHIFGGNFLDPSDQT